MSERVGRISPVAELMPRILRANAAPARRHDERREER
jgi:hypothetical protein